MEENRIMQGTKITEDEDELKLRPTSLKEYIGQEDIKKKFRSIYSG